MLNSADSYQSLKSTFQIDNNTGLKLESGWQQAIPHISPEFFIQLFKFDNAFKISNAQLTINPGSVDAEVFYAYGNRPAGHVKITFSGQGSANKIEKLFGAPDDPELPKLGIHFGSKFFASLLTFSKKLGQDIETEADYEIGPRFYNQIGFKMNDYYAETMREKLTARFNEIIPSIAEDNADVIRDVNALLERRTHDFSKVMWILADIDFPVKPLPTHSASLKCDAMGMIPLGLALFSGRDMCWSGRFEIRSTDCLEKANTYLQEKGIGIRQ